MAFEVEKRDLICGVCGESSPQDVVVSYDPDSSMPDLDLRPDEPHRSYLKYWVQECPCCGYCNASVDIPAVFTREFLESDRYNNTELSGLADKFMKMSMVCVKNKLYEEALKACLYAAWACDDEKDDEGAVRCRKAALKVYHDHRNAFAGDPNILILVADLMRRSGDFDGVIREYMNRFFPMPILTAISAFEVQLAAKKDPFRHSVGEIQGASLK